MPFSHPIEVRFRDVDALGHVNNAVVVSYLEVARYAWWRGFLKGRAFRDEGFLIARAEVDYRLPIQLGDDVRVELRCPRVGRTSFDLEYRVVRQGNLLLAEGRTIQVMLDFASGRPVVVGAATRSWLETQA
jgi:acyl-CoA thioester hydrolase